MDIKPTMISYGGYESSAISAVSILTAEQSFAGVTSERCQTTDRPAPTARDW